MDRSMTFLAAGLLVASLAAKRFVIEVRGDNTPVEQIRAVLDLIDIAKLEALAK